MQIVAAPPETAVAADDPAEAHGGAARRTSLRAMGFVVRGRSYVLRLNYRTSIDQTSDDLDGGRVARTCRSAFRGAEPTVRGFATAQEQYEYAAATINRWRADGNALDEVAVIARTNHYWERAKRALAKVGIPGRKLGQRALDGAGAAVAFGTMHGVKGLEFKSVFLVDASNRTLPLPVALADLSDPQDEADALAQERQLVYVSLTRARDQRIVTRSGERSTLLEEALRALAGKRSDGRVSVPA